MLRKTKNPLPVGKWVSNFGATISPSGKTPSQAASVIDGSIDLVSKVTENTKRQLRAHYARKPCRGDHAALDDVFGFGLHAYWSGKIRG
jgi:hypothetical protein